MSRRLLILVVVLGLGAMCRPTSAETSEKKGNRHNAVPQPQLRIPLEKLGLRGTPTPGLLRTQASIATLDFIDSDHVLLTFAARPLIARAPEAAEGEAEKVPVSAAHPRDDRTVHAEVVELSSARVLQERDWRLHDRAPYLLGLGGGEFLLRRGGRLEVLKPGLHGELEERRLAESSDPIVHLQADMGSGLLLVEKEHEIHTPEQHAQMAHDALLSDAKPPVEQADVYGWKLPLDLPDAPAAGGGGLPRTPLLHGRLPREGAVAGNSEGLLQFSSAGKKSELYFVPFASSEPKRLLLKVASDCRPVAKMLRSDVALVTACRGYGSELFAVKMDGTVLWSERSQAGALPDAVAAENGQRFAMQSVGETVTSPVAVPTEEDFGQGLVQVFDVDSGARVFSTVLEPLYAAYRTVALSADGLRLAVLRKGALEVYALAAVEAGSAAGAAQDKKRAKK